MCKYSFLILCFLFIISCSKDSPDDVHQDDGQGSTFILNDDVVVFDASIYEYITFAKDGCLKLSSMAPTELIPGEGQIICAGISNNTPSGYIGRICAISETENEYVLKTEAVQLSEVFEELHVNLNMDITKNLIEAEDTESNIYVSEMVSGDIWNTLSETYSDSLSFLSTKADNGFEIQPCTMSLPISTDYFEGKLFVKFGMSVVIDISANYNINKFDISISEMAGIDGEWTIESSGEKKFELSDLSYKFSPIVIPGTPIVVIPEAYSNLTMQIDDTARLVTSFRYCIANDKYCFHFDGNNVSFDSQEYSADDDQYCRFKSIDCHSSITLSPTIGLKFSLWNDNVLALGSELTSDLNYKFESSVSMEDENLLITNPHVVINPTMGISLYAESLLFKYLPGSEDGRYAWKKEIEGNSVEITALPVFKDITINQTDNIISVTSDLVPSSLLRYEEAGFALFEQGCEFPIEHKRQYKDITTRADFSEISFTKPDTTRAYIVRPYVLVGENYYYGGLKKKRVKSYYYNGFLSGHVYYDEFNRINRIDDDTYSMSVSYDESGTHATINTRIGGGDEVDTYDVDFSDGKVTRIIDAFIYYDVNGYISSSSVHGYPIEYTVIDGNITHYYLYGYDESVSYTYTHYHNKLTYDVLSENFIDLPGGYTFFSGPVTAKLPATIRVNGQAYSSFSYLFDEDGYVTKISVVGEGPIGIFSFDYEEYYE